jgi:hypothetical protein
MVMVSGTTIQVTGFTTYDEEGTYHISVSIDGPGGPRSMLLAAQFADASLSGSAMNGSSFSATAGQEFGGQLLGFSDADPKGEAGDYAASIDWGDSTSSPGGVLDFGNRNYSATGSHTYDRKGTYQALVVVSDVGGSSVGGNLTVNVTTATPHSYTGADTHAYAHARAGSGILRGMMAY